MMVHMHSSAGSIAMVKVRSWVVWTCLLVVLLLHSQTLDAISSEGEVLLRFKRDSGLSSHNFWTAWDNWNASDVNPCGWIGVTCNAHLTVERLDFSRWSLTGLMYGLPHLCDLASLRELDMSSNNFVVDGVPPCFSNLTFLDFSGNDKSQFPVDAISWMHNLQYLYLDGNSLGRIGLPELDGLVNLQVLSLSGNGFTGSIPRLGNLTRLKILDLSNNELDGSIPNLEGLTSLASLRLNNNNLSGQIPKLEGLTSLLSLDLSGNRLQGFSDGAAFQASPSLREVYVSGNRLEGMLPDAIAQLPNLTYLDLSENSLGGQMPSGYQSVIYLDLSSNQLSGQIPSALGHVYYLDLSSNHLSGQIPQDIRRNDDLSELRFPFWRDLSGNDLNGTIPPLLFWPGPSYISSIYFKLPHELEGFGMYLNLTKNSLMGHIPDPGASYVGYSDFGTIDLSDNQLEGLIPPFFAKVNVDYLCLQNNQLYGDINHWINKGHFWYMQQVRLQGNRFTGDITLLLEDNQYAGILTVLDFSNNHLSMTPTPNYSEPLQLFLQHSSGSLLELRLAGNNLSGLTLPRSLNKLDYALQVLDLSNTNLEGDIQSEFFIRLSNLSYFNVSDNELSGTIPSNSLPRILADPAFFMGNPGLCGWPLPDCARPGQTRINVWVLSGVIIAAAFISMGSCLLLAWQWRVNSKKHQQDRDLIETLMERQVTVSVMPLRELRKATQNFSVSNQIGVGGFGTVYRGELADGTTVAIKRSRREGTLHDKQQFLNEVRILSQVNHRHLVKLLGCCMENKVALLVFEYVPNGTLQEHLQGKSALGRQGGFRLTWRQRLQIAVQTGDALAYLHSAANPPIFHRDVKSANILLDEDLNARVADFGISKLAPMGATHVSTVAAGTIGYMDPEYYTTFQLTSKSDVYGFGVVLLELISAKSPVDVMRGCEEVSLVNMAVSAVNKGEWQQLIDPILMKTFDSPTGRASIQTVAQLAISCLAMRSKDRPEMKNVWQHLQTLWLQSDASFDCTCNQPEGMPKGGEDDACDDSVSLVVSDYSQYSHTLSTSSFGGHIEMRQLASPIARQ